MVERLIFHVDVNSAFLSWEATKRVKNGEPDLRLVPSCVGGDPKKRTGIVVAKSIPAKKYGIVTGEPMVQALRKCPNLVCVPADFALYLECSRAFKEICQEYTPTMESYSIDEVFLDMTGMGMLYPDPIVLANTLKNRIRDELGFTVNIGIGENKVLAKMASDFEKPDKVHTLYRSEIPQKMWRLSVGELFTCGKSSVEKLTRAGIRTIGDLAHADQKELQYLLGEKQGMHLYRYANGIDDEPVHAVQDEAKGYSAETTLEEDLVDIASIERILMAQADIVSARMRLEDAKCRCVAVSYKTAQFQTKSHQRKLKQSTDVTDEIYQIARQLMRECWHMEPVRLVGIALTDIDRGGFEQMSFLVDEKKERFKKLDSALDSIRGKYGNDSVQRASTIDQEKRISRKFRAQMEITRREERQE